jgi:3-oxoacyl-[acyl-carrier-protein] synthase II
MSKLSSPLKAKRKIDPRRRVVVTGLGVVSSIGIGVEEFWKNLIAGKSGISEIERFDTSAYPVHKGGEVKNFKPEHFIDKRKIKHMGRASQMAIAAAKLAISDAFLKKKDVKEAGIFMGTTMGEIGELEDMNVDWLGKGADGIKQSSIYLFPTNAITVNMALEFKIKGYNFMIPTACAAGNYSVGYAFDLIRNGHLNMALVGGSDSFSRIAFTGFNRLMAMAPEKCQPFDKNRKGMMLGEGAGVLILESLERAEKRKAKIYAEVLGYGLSCDAHHMTQPSEDGIVRCMEKALKEAGVSKEKVDYISAHGTGTPQNDKIECAALKKVFGGRATKIPCSSIKSMLGHTLGAASALEAVACCMVIDKERLPPTINFENSDDECPIDCVGNSSRSHVSKFVMNNSYAFGGNNCSVLFKSI